MKSVLPKTFSLAVEKWSSAHLSSDETRQRLLHELRHLADENTNVYLVDNMMTETPERFGFRIDVSHFDLRVPAPANDVLGSHPDKAYSRKDVLPQYHHVAKTGEVRFDTLRSKILGVLAHYDRIILPVKSDPKTKLPTHAIALSRPRLIVEIGQGDIGTLSPRELAIFNRIASGYSSKEVARELGASPRTVETHLTSIKTKLGARNIVHAVALYTLRQLFD